ncbi:hypothetical protein BDK51DRAFT_34157 [Blyttiomyces helicus]|uniref:Uncharacterized protein n=1 Tax=Blyttiomyces helicus TaxID=388810 RepID=A0A4P9WGN3_9FUNG|nr:hypothetical protein BDK51DRAFT_34157 [Blyttiomyces helicus]|eukprot:RKO90200.1 hypothetical protein BDK51DRAFT_34157 [Blyttiomyces helicus]
MPGRRKTMLQKQGALEQVEVHYRKLLDNNLQSGGAKIWPDSLASILETVNLEHCNPCMVIAGAIFKIKRFNERPQSELLSNLEWVREFCLETVFSHDPEFKALQERATKPLEETILKDIYRAYRHIEYGTSPRPKGIDAWNDLASISGWELAVISGPRLFDSMVGLGVLPLSSIIRSRYSRWKSTTMETAVDNVRFHANRLASSLGLGLSEDVYRSALLRVLGDFHKIRQNVIVPVYSGGRLMAPHSIPAILDKQYSLSIRATKTGHSIHDDILRLKALSIRRGLEGGIAVNFNQDLDLPLVIVQSFVLCPEDGLHIERQGPPKEVRRAPSPEKIHEICKLLEASAKRVYAAMGIGETLYLEALLIEFDNADPDGHVVVRGEHVKVDYNDETLAIRTIDVLVGDSVAVCVRALKTNLPLTDSMQALQELCSVVHIPTVIGFNFGQSAKNRGINMEVLGPR